MDVSQDKLARYLNVTHESPPMHSHKHGATMECRPAVVLISDSVSLCSNFPSQCLPTDNISDKDEEHTIVDIFDGSYAFANLNHVSQQSCMSTCRRRVGSTTMGRKKKEQQRTCEMYVEFIRHCRTGDFREYHDGNSQVGIPSEEKEVLGLRTSGIEGDQVYGETVYLSFRPVDSATSDAARRRWKVESN